MTYVIKTKPGCDFCVKAKELIATTGEQIFEQVYTTAVEIANFKVEGFKTFPQIFHNGTHVGGYDALALFIADNEAF